MHWKGSYGPANVPNAESMLYHVASTKEVGEDKDIHISYAAIPVTWFDQSKSYYVYPPGDYLVGNKEPIDWANRTYFRHASPSMGWLEYDVLNIETDDKPSNISSCSLGYQLRSINQTWLLMCRRLQKYLEDPEAHPRRCW